MTPANRHQDLELLLIEGRANGTLSEAQDTEISEEMEYLWYEMSKEERRRAQERIAILREAYPSAFERN